MGRVRTPSPPAPLAQAGEGRGRRWGFTLVELLVVISILSVLLALLLPAVMASRAAARRVECQNNQQNLAVVMLSEVDAKRRFPASGHFSIRGVPHHTWIVSLLAGLERADLAERWDLEQPSHDPQNQTVATTSIPILVCPDDDSIQPGQGNLSYVVNGGFGWTHASPAPDCPSAFHVLGFPPVQPIDLNGNGVACPSGPETDKVTDKELFFRTGLFFLENWPYGTGTVRHHTAETVLDGLSSTLMFSENVRAGYDPYSAGATGWSCPFAWRHSFFLSSYVCQDGRCGAGRVDYDRANSRRHPYALEAINAGLTQAEGEAPWPSSYHGDGVNVVFADGHVHFLSEKIDGPVYSSLVSPAGASIEGPLKQVVVPGEY
ncbi:MAG: DUF1559 domain-containing protein [Pirellulales bacterium]|nr:DUF1559 domain-containing protein [Pirellulales bacterium]